MIGEVNFVHVDKSPENSQTLVKIPIKINRIKCISVIDTGSTISIVHPNLIEFLNESPKVKHGTRVRLLDSSLTELNQVIRLEVEIDEEFFLHEFYIYDKLRYQVLLGLDFCRKANFSINFDKDADEKINNSNLLSNDLKSDVRLKREYIIPPKGLMKLECQLEFDIGLGYFKPDKRIREEFYVDIQETIIEASNTCHIFVFNPKPIQTLLCNNLKIGTIQSVTQNQMENLLVINEESEKKFSDKPFIIESKKPSEIKKLNELLESNRDLFGENVGQLGRAIGVQHEINLTTDEPVKLAAYRVSPKEKQIIREQVKEMLENKVIEESNSPYSAPVVLVKKKNGKIRFCIDYRKLNEVTIKDRHPLPLISDTINIMNNSKYFSVMDLLSGYWNVIIKPEDRHKTAFITPDGLYQWIVMPFGLTNSPGTFQRFMQKTMADILYKFVVVYLDDFLIFSSTFEDHLNHLRQFFERIRQFNLRLGIEKCRFLCSEVKYLGHLINGDGIKPDPDKIKAVEDFKTPKSVKDIQSFLGLTGYYRTFVKDYAFIADPLTKLLRKNTKFEWTTNCENAFQQLKQSLITTPILAQFKEDAENEIFCDACSYGMSAILGQVQDGKHVVISYNSKLFNPQQINYSITEKECLALVYAVKKYRHYIYGSHFTVYTDHNPLQFLMKIKNPNGRLTRWSMLLMEYDFTVEYKPGKKHQNADTLSRYPYDPADEKDEEIVLLINETIDLKSYQKTDEWCDGLRKIIENRSKNSNKYTIKDDIIYRKSYDSNHNPILLICLPKKLRRQVLRDLHDSEIGGGHLGTLKTYFKVRKRFFWPNCEKTVRSYIRNCPSCQLLKDEKQPEKGLMQMMDISAPFECCGVDILGPITPSSKGHQYIIIFIDLFTKWLETKAIKNTQSETLAKWFCYEIMPRHGAINRILTDNASYFTSEFSEMVFQLSSSKHITSTSYSPQTNGNAERACGTVKNMLKAYVDKSHSNWDFYLPMVTFCYNASEQKTTRFSPFFLLYNREPKFPLDISMKLPDDFTFGKKYRNSYEEIRELVKHRIDESQKDNKQNYDEKHRDIELNVGDLVSLHTPHTEIGLSKKLLAQKTGPYKIIEKHSQINYTIQDVDNPDIIERVHIRRLQKWNADYIPELDDLDKKEIERIIKNKQGIKLIPRPGYISEEKDKTL